MVEKGKPRVCTNGKIAGYVKPKEKPECILDDARQFLQTVRPGDYLTKLDDASGFSQLLLDRLSQT